MTDLEIAHLQNEDKFLIHQIVAKNPEFRELLDPYILHDACKVGNIGLVKYLINLKFRNIEDLRGNYPLHYAAINGYPDIVRLLIRQSDCKKIINHKNLKGLTTMHVLASSHDNEKVIDLLMRNGADLFIENDLGCTALDIAIHAGNDFVFNWHPLRF